MTWWGEEGFLRKGNSSLSLEGRGRCHHPDGFKKTFWSEGTTCQRLIKKQNDIFKELRNTSHEQSEINVQNMRL